MTRYEIRIDELVLRGLPEGYADALAGTLAGRLEEELRTQVPSTPGLMDRAEDVVRPRPEATPVADVTELAGRVAAGIWSAASGGSAGERGPR